MNVNLLSQTLHFIDDVFYPGAQPFVSPLYAEQFFDIALVKLGKILIFEYNETSG